jgi:anti-sigma regulatory factor (Ser/Thr protein kinase)
MTTFVFELPATPTAASVARRALLAGNGALPGSIRDDVVLLVTELVTNAVRHAGAGPERPLQVRLLHRPRCVVVAVADEGPGFTWDPKASAGSESGGWGLFLVDQIADRWGVERTTSGSCVWAEIGYSDPRRLGNPPRDQPPHDSGPPGSPWPRIDRDPALPPGPASRSPGCSAWLLP